MVGWMVLLGVVWGVGVPLGASRAVGAVGAEEEVWSVEMYDVRDLLGAEHGTGEGMGAEGLEEAERASPRGSVEAVSGLIRGLVGSPEHWAGGGGAISELHGHLVVKTTAANQREVGKLMAKLRERAGRQVAVEVRVLRLRTGLMDRLNAELTGRDLVLDAERAAFLERLTGRADEAGIRVLATARTVLADGQTVTLLQSREAEPGAIPATQPEQDEGVSPHQGAAADATLEGLAGVDEAAATAGDESVDEDLAALRAVFEGEPRSRRPTRRSEEEVEEAGNPSAIEDGSGAGAKAGAGLGAEAEGSDAFDDDATDHGGVVVGARVSDNAGEVLLDLRADVSLHADEGRVIRGVWQATARVPAGGGVLVTASLEASPADAALDGGGEELVLFVTARVVGSGGTGRVAAVE